MRCGDRSRGGCRRVEDVTQLACNMREGVASGGGVGGLWKLEEARLQPARRGQPRQQFVGLLASRTVR